MAANDRKALPPLNSRSASEDSLKPPRTARFAEATSVDSPIEATAGGFRFTEAAYTPVESHRPQLQPGDVGFGYVNDRRSQADMPHIELPAGNSAISLQPPLSPSLRSPGLKSAMKSPGFSKPSRIDLPLKSPMFQEEQILSPTWREEKLLERRETRTTRRQAEDLRVKVRVRMAKLVLRFTNFSCSLIVLAMLGTVVTIFNSTVNLPPRNNLPAWAPNTPRWQQLTVLSIACVSLFFSIVILIAYCRKGHKRAEKWAAYYSIFAVGFFVVSIIMWAVGAGILQHAKKHGKGKDLWGWSCKTNTRERVFGTPINGGTPVNYALLCRLQNWSLVCCIIEVVVEVITILVYGIVFYRYWSKRQLSKTMATRDKARSELYMSQLRSPGSNGYFPATPGIPAGPASPRDGGYNPMYSPRFAAGTDAAGKGQVGVGQGTQFTSLAGEIQPAPGNFTLSKPPTKSPKTRQGAGWGDDTPASPTVRENFNEHVNAAPGEQHYGAVPVPGAYTSPLASAAAGGEFQGFAR